MSTPCGVSPYLRTQPSAISAYRAEQFEGFTPINSATPKDIGQGITTAGRFKMPPSRELKLLGGAAVTEQASVPAPNLGRIILSMTCSKTLVGPMTWSSQAQLDGAFASSDCLQVSGDVQLNFDAKLANPVLLVTDKGGLKASQGLEMNQSKVIAEHVHVNKQLIVVDSRVFSRDT